ECPEKCPIGFPPSRREGGRGMGQSNHNHSITLERPCTLSVSLCEPSHKKRYNRASVFRVSYIPLTQCAIHHQTLSTNRRVIMSFTHIRVPEGEKITYANGKLHVPDNPIVAFIEGDGIGVDITPASIKVWDAAVEKA